MHKWLGLVVALAGCAGAGAGKGAAPGENHATTSPTATGSGGGRPDEASEVAAVKLPPYPAAPADPWRGVVGDQPRRWSEDRARHWMIRSDEFDCSAAHDHCIDPDAWFFVRDADHERGLPVAAAWDVFGSDGKPATAANVRRPAVADDGWHAFRTVPATRNNLVRGAGVITLDRGAAKPTSGVASHDASWSFGVADEVDFGQASFTIANGAGAYPLWGARVVVLSWAPGTKVQIVGGKQRSELGVKVSETFSTQ